MERLPSILLYIMMIAGVGTFFYGLYSENYDPMLYLTYILSVGSIALTILGTLYQAVQNPAKIKGSLLGIGIMGAIVGVSYVMASGADYETYKTPVTETASKMTEMGLYVLYALSVMSVLAILYSSVSRIFK